ncbi:G-gamma domain-containing protein [Cephalotus follicularis]|uniref:G-gamma domain-containing protein n=1 Tax=Cephalotus follicularis TaxID=3775 RepID=A0A1Q3B0A3_CEPFO|nr:G-gamma domain-containing protein [Cephalotus follicularis]
MDGWCNSCSSSVSSYGSSLVTQPISPKSPPGGFDLYGKRRQMVKVQVLEREIGLLQEELKSVEGLQPASRCCKELDDFIVAKPDPLIAINSKNRESCRFWKRLWRKCCLNVPWICCFRSCSLHIEMPNCYTCCCCSPCKPQCTSCGCLEKITCSRCCKSMVVSRPYQACCCFSSVFRRCKKVNLSCNCPKTCYNPCCL